MRAMRYSSGGAAAEEWGLRRRRVGLGQGQIPVVVPESGELGVELELEYRAETAGGAAEGDLKRRRDAGVGERAASRPGRVRGRERAEGVGGSSGTRCANYLLVPAARRK